MSRMTTEEELVRVGVIQERAKRAGQSLNEMERSLISWVRYVAKKEGMSLYMVRALEMEGERDWKRVLAPIKVVAKFASYIECEGFAPEPDFFVLQSNVPMLVTGGNVCTEQFQKVGLPIPKSPKYEKWVRGGRKVFLGRTGG